jgi:hypothetical protein
MVPNPQALPGQTEGFVSVGILIGHLSFIDHFMTQKLTDLQAEFQKLISYPHPHDFLLLLRYCCNQKLIYLL